MLFDETSDDDLVDANNKNNFLVVGTRRSAVIETINGVITDELQRLEVGLLSHPDREGSLVIFVGPDDEGNDRLENSDEFERAIGSMNITPAKALAWKAAKMRNVARFAEFFACEGYRQNCTPVFVSYSDASQRRKVK